MYDSIILFKDHKAFLEKTEKNEETKKRETQLLEITSLIPFLNYEVSFEDGTLFDDVWSFIEKDYETFEVLFSGVINNQNLDTYVKQFHKPKKEKTKIDDQHPGIDYFELSYGAEVEIFRNEKEFNYGPCLNFRGKMKDADGNYYNGYYGMTFTPINDWKGYEIKISDSYSINFWNLDSTDPDDKYSTLHDNIVTKMTVYDMLYAILDEVSWGGDPEEQEQKLKELQQIAENVKNGKEKLIPLEDVIKEMKERIDSEENNDH